MNQTPTHPLAGKIDLALQGMRESVAGRTTIPGPVTCLILMMLRSLEELIKDLLASLASGASRDDAFASGKRAGAPSGPGGGTRSADAGLDAEADGSSKHGATDGCGRGDDDGRDDDGRDDDGCDDARRGDDGRGDDLHDGGGSYAGCDDRHAAAASQGSEDGSSVGDLRDARSDDASFDDASLDDASLGDASLDEANSDDANSDDALLGEAPSGVAGAIVGTRRDAADDRIRSDAAARGHGSARQQHGIGDQATEDRAWNRRFFDGPAPVVFV